MSDGPIRDEAIRTMTSLFQVAGGTGRLRILCLLAGGERGVSSIHEECERTQAAVSSSIALLKASGLIEDRREGQRVIYGLTSKGEAVMAFGRSMATLPLRCSDDRRRT